MAYPGRGLSRAECVHFIKSLNRKDDEGLFLNDIAETHPQLLADYVKVCPTRTDLTKMGKEAAEGKYSTGADNPSATEEGRKEPDGLGAERLRRDIELLADNCIKFNPHPHSLAVVAEDFKERGLAALDNLCLTVPVVKHNKQARTSGVAGAKPQAAVAAAASPVAVDASRKKRPRDTTDPTVKPEPGNRDVSLPPPLQQQPPLPGRQRGGLRAPVGGVAPARAVPLQAGATEPHHVPFTVPMRLREILVKAHWAQGERKLLFGGNISPSSSSGKDSAPLPVVSEVLDAFLGQTYKAIDVKAPFPMHGLKNKKIEAEEETEAPAVSRDVVAQQLSAQLKLQQKRHYTNVIGQLQKAFNTCFEAMLLYPSELAELDWFAARYNAVTRTMTTTPNSGGGEGDGKEGNNNNNNAASAHQGEAVPWDELVSAHYLLRFLVHVPQIAHLAAHPPLREKISSASSNSSKNSSGSAEVVVESVVPVAEDLLFYLDAVSNQLPGLE